MKRRKRREARGQSATLDQGDPAKVRRRDGRGRRRKRGRAQPDAEAWYHQVPPLFEEPVADDGPASAAAPSVHASTVLMTEPEPSPVEATDGDGYTGEARTYGAVPPATPPPMARTAPLMGEALAPPPGAEQYHVPDSIVDDASPYVGAPEEYLPAEAAEEYLPAEAEAAEETAGDGAALDGAAIDESAIDGDAIDESAIDESVGDESEPPVTVHDSGEDAEAPSTEAVAQRPFLHDAEVPPALDPPMIIPIRAYYMTRADDTLRSISAQFLNTPSRWQELRSLNAGYPGIADAGADSVLPVGSSIALPGDPLPWGKPDPVYLWTLAEKFLYAAWGREPSPDEVVPFWRGLTSGAQHLEEAPSARAAVGEVAAGLAEPPIPPAMQPPGMPPERAEVAEPPAATAEVAEPPERAETAEVPPSPPAEPVVAAPATDTSPTAEPGAAGEPSMDAGVAPAASPAEPSPDIGSQPSMVPAGAEEASPVDSGEPAVAEEASPVDGPFAPPVMPAAASEMPPTGAGASPGLVEPLPPVYEPPPLPPAEPSPPVYEPVAPPAEPSPPVYEPVAPPAEPLPPVYEPVAPPAEPLPPVYEPVAPPAEPLPPVYEPVAPPAEPLPPVYEPVAPPAEPLPPVYEPVAPPAEPLPPVYEPVAPPAEPSSPVYEPVAPPAEPPSPVYEPPPLPPAEPSPPVYEPVAPPAEPPSPVYEPVAPPAEPSPPVYEPVAPPAEPPSPVYEPPLPPAEVPPPPSYEAPPQPYQPPSTPAPGHEPVLGMPDLAPVGAPESLESETDTLLPAFMPSLTGAPPSADLPVEQVVAATAPQRMFAGTAIGDAMLLWQLGRLRRRRTAAGESVPNPLELSLQQTARMDSLRLIEAAMRQLRAVTVGRFAPKPRVVCVRTGAYGFEVLLNSPVDLPEGWQAASGGYVLELRQDVTLEQLDAVGQGPSLCPTLVPVGDTAEGPLLLNLEEIGCLAVSGPADASASLLGSVVEMLGSSPLAGNVRIITVGVSAPSGPGWERVHASSFDSPQLEHLLATANSPAYAESNATLDVLVAGPGNDILFQRAGQVATGAGSRLMLVGATSSQAARWPWRIHLDERHRAVVYPISVNITATQAMRPELAYLLSEGAEEPRPTSSP